MTNEDPETIAVYERRVREYASLAEPAASGSREAFTFAVVAGGTVLDWGCGPGHDAVRFAAAGFRVDAVDASAAMIAHVADAQGVSARRGAFDELDVVAAYDGIWANFSLLHAPRPDMPRHLRAARRALRVGGVCYVSVKRGDGERRDALGRRYNDYTEPELATLLRDAGFTVRERFGGESSGLDGVRAAWIGLLSAAHE